MLGFYRPGLWVRVWVLFVVLYVGAMHPVCAGTLTNTVESTSHVPPIKTEVALGGVVLALSATNDSQLAQWLQAPHEPSTIARGVTALADPVGLAVLHAVIYRQNPELAWRSVKSVVTALTVTEALKVLLGRTRPDTPGSTGAYTGFSLSDAYQSMPSGHTTAAFAMARVLAKEDPEHAVAYYAGATLVGLSRVNLARHWPSDVVAGALIGLSVGRYF